MTRSVAIPIVSRPMTLGPTSAPSRLSLSTSISHRHPPSLKCPSSWELRHQAADSPRQLAGRSQLRMGRSKPDDYKDAGNTSWEHLDEQ
jgi:hypothetical protein